MYVTFPAVCNWVTEYNRRFLVQHHAPQYRLSISPKSVCTHITIPVLTCTSPQRNSHNYTAIIRYMYSRQWAWLWKPPATCACCRRQSYPRTSPPPAPGSTHAAAGNMQRYSDPTHVVQVAVWRHHARHQRLFWSVSAETSHDWSVSASALLAYPQLHHQPSQFIWIEIPAANINYCVFLFHRWSLTNAQFSSWFHCSFCPMHAEKEL